MRNCQKMMMTYLSVFWWRRFRWWKGRQPTAHASQVVTVSLVSRRSLQDYTHKVWGNVSWECHYDFSHKISFAVCEDWGWCSKKDKQFSFQPGIKIWNCPVQGVNWACIKLILCWQYGYWNSPQDFESIKRIVICIGFIPKGQQSFFWHCHMHFLSQSDHFKSSCYHLPFLLLLFSKYLGLSWYLWYQGCFQRGCVENNFAAKSLTPITTGSAATCHKKINDSFSSNARSEELFWTRCICESPQPDGPAFHKPPHWLPVISSRNIL